MAQQHSKPRARLTVADYMNTPDDVRYQLIDGELVLAPSPSTRHQSVSSELFVVLHQFVRQHGLGMVWDAPLDVVLSDNEVFQPDILFVSNERRGIVTEANIRGAPDLVVEILSPSTRQHDEGHKREVYSGHGVKEYWIVDPEDGMVQVLAASEAGLAPSGIFSREDSLVSMLLPGFAVELSQVFAGV